MVRVPAFIRRSEYDLRSKVVQYAGELLYQVRQMRVYFLIHEAKANALSGLNSDHLQSGEQLFAACRGILAGRGEPGGLRIPRVLRGSVCHVRQSDIAVSVTAHPDGRSNGLVIRMRRHDQTTCALVLHSGLPWLRRLKSGA